MRYPRLFAAGLLALMPQAVLSQAVAANPQGSGPIVAALAWLQGNDADPSKLNVNCGAIALGHPLGGSGTKLMSTLVHALRKNGKRYGLQTMCEGGGLANVTIVEAL